MRAAGEDRRNKGRHKDGMKQTQGHAEGSSWPGVGVGVEPIELDAPQFTLLLALSTRPGISQAQLGQALGMDKTTLSVSDCLISRRREALAART